MSQFGYNSGKFYSFRSRPVLIDCNFIVDSTNGNGLGQRSLKGLGVQQVFMHTAETPLLGNPNPAVGLIAIQLMNNYRKYMGGFSGFVSPTSGGTDAINATALTIGNPYIIASVGHGPVGVVTIAPVADSSGSLASTYFVLPDAYGNVFAVWFYVTGIGGTPPSLGSGVTLIQQTIAENASADAITTALSATLILASGPASPAGVLSFTASGGGTATLTVTSTNQTPYQPLPGPIQDGVIPTGFTFALTKYGTNQNAWNKVGLQAGVIPNVGASFIATATGYATGGGSTGLVVAPGVSGITSMEIVGDPNQTLSPRVMGSSPNGGGWILVQCLGASSSSVTTLIPTAPANGSTVGMSFLVDAGSPV